MKIVFLLLGGGVGTLCRYLLVEFLVKYSVNRVFPTAILIVNLLGSFGLGLFIGAVGVRSDSVVSLMVGAGFFGAFTTFSTFSLETLELIRNRKWGSVFFYLIATIIGAITLFFLGLTLIN